MTIPRILSSLVSPVLGLLKKPWAERLAVRNPMATSSIDELDNETFVHLGVDSLAGGDWKGIFNVFLSHLVRGAPFSLPHVNEWLSQTETQQQLKRLAHARIASAAEPSDARVALIDSYMQISGEHRSSAESIVDHAVTVLSSGVLGAVKDTSAVGVLQISMHALHQRFDELVKQFDVHALPEPGWSLSVACAANESWLLNAFSSRSKAKVRLGQPLNPADTKASITPIPRADLVGRFTTLLGELPYGGAVAITGDEGNGKSWLVAQAWLSLPVKPLTLFLTAEDVGEKPIDPISLIIRKLCVQTDRQESVRYQSWWSTQLDKWREQHQRPTQGFLIVLDGLNQRPRTEWARLIDQFSEELERLGGNLIYTSRRRYYDGVVKPQLVAPCRELVVPEWTPSERDQLLTANGMDGNHLHQRVAKSLCNPRLLGIALTLFESAHLQSMEELSISLLLFEHLRASQRDSYDRSAEHFKRKLQDHAKEVLGRLNTQQRDDLNVFDGGLDAVVEGRFFIPLAEDVTRYTVSEEGLGLALGLAILDALQKAQRNGRDLNEALALLAEPIAALDQTADAILAALTVACMSTEYSTEVGVAVLIGFAGLQNLEEHTFDAIIVLARTRTPIFLEVVRALALQGGIAVNFDWIELALQAVKSEELPWQAIEPEIKLWLAHITLDIEEQIFPHQKSPEEVTQQRITLQSKLDTKLAGLSNEERGILNVLKQTKAQDVSVLSKVTLKLLAGMPLAQFTQAFVNWSFARSLNGNSYAPIDEFYQLIRFNGVDWQETRASLLQSSELLRNGTPSPTGQWALVCLLQATGHPDDARYAQELVDVLRAGQPKGMRWRLIENYCSTDPCDPNNTEPDNVASTAGKYAAIEITKLCLHMGISGEDHFLRDALPAISRYYTDIAIERHRALIEDVLSRRGLALRQGIFGLLAHSALVTTKQAQQLADRTYCIANIDAWRSLGDEADILMQFQLQLAFPALDAHAQFNALIQGNFKEGLLINLINLIKPLNLEIFEAKIADAIAADDDEARLTVLLFSPFSNQMLPPAIRDYIPRLLRSNSTKVRAYTLRMIAQSGDTDALRVVVKSGWSAAHLDKTQELERWHGSEVLLEAAVQSIAPWENLVANMDYQHLGRLSQQLGRDAAKYVANITDKLIERSLELPIGKNLEELNIEITQQYDIAPQFQYFSLNEQKLPPTDSTDAWVRAFEHGDDFKERQKKLHAAFDAFQENLTRINAGLLLNQFSMEDFLAITEADPVLTERWCSLLLDTPNGIYLRAVRNIALLLANSISKHDPAHAAQLFEKFEPIAPLVRMVFGRSGIELGAMATWSATDHPEIDALRVRRLDCAENNDALAIEVWAALWNGKSTQLTHYINKRLASGWPAAQARAILVAGFMGENPDSNKILAQFSDVPGLLGATQRIAREAYDHHLWSMHWFNLMQAAPSPEVFWRAAVLFLTVADGRIEALKVAHKPAQPSFYLFWPSIEDRLKNRFNKLQEKYKKNLLDDKAPSTIFLSSSKPNIIDHQSKFNNPIL